MNKYLIGIDTGGTFTDGVLLHYATREVVSAAKTLTTRKDLKQGVIRVLEKLEIPENCSIKMVGISSTLATNSIAEGKARHVALLLIGYQKDLVSKFGLGDDFATEDITYINGGHNAQGTEQAPLDEKAVKSWIKKKKNEVDAIAVSSYFSPLNPDHEKQAMKIVAEESDLPVVMGHQLSTKLNSVKRAATASINASLVAVMQDFLQSVKRSLKTLRVEAPLMIVRGDGTLMPYSEAINKPVETVLSGPAASAIGGIFLSGKSHSLVIDMGSTTTDMALVDNARVVVSESGARVGETETAVKAGRIRTISMGCDSSINIKDNGEITIGPDRIRSLSQISLHHKHVKETIRQLADKDFEKTKSRYDLVFWYHHDNLDEHTSNTLTEKQKSILKKLEKPQQVSKLMDDLQVCHPDHLDMNDLIVQGFIEISGFNPSDLLHASGAMNMWDAETAQIAAKAYCHLYGFTFSQLKEGVFDKMVDMLVEEIILYLACKNTDDMPDNIDDAWGKWLLNEILYHDNDLLSIDVSSRPPFIGTGAPARHFIKEVASMMNTKLILPRYSEVANAVGAVSGSVSETREALVFIREDNVHFAYYVKYNDQMESFDSYTRACEFAENKASQLARQATIDAGGSDPFTEVKRISEGSLTRFVGRAVGNPRLSKTHKMNQND